jgi:large subunit ribosomal protein L24
MAMKKLRKGDQVVVLSGKDKGRTGSITRMVTDDTVLIEGVHVSKVAIWNAGSKKADRVGVKTLADGKRVRFLKSNNEVLDVK